MNENPPRKAFKPIREQLAENRANAKVPEFETFSDRRARLREAVEAVEASEPFKEPTMEPESAGPSEHFKEISQRALHSYMASQGMGGYRNRPSTITSSAEAATPPVESKPDTQRPASPGTQAADSDVPRTMREEMDLKGIKLYSDRSGPTRFSDRVPQRTSSESIAPVAGGLAAEKNSYESARDEYLRESKRFYEEHTHVGRLLSRVQQAQLEKLKQAKDESRIKYADAMERSAIDRLKERGKSGEYIERALEKYRGIIRYNEIVRPDREAAIRARLEALGEKGPLLHEKILAGLSTSNNWMEGKMGKIGARAFRATIASIIVTGAAALAGAFGADNATAVLGYGAARAGRSFASAALAVPAGLFAGKIVEKKARNTKAQAKTDLESLMRNERRGSMTYDSLVAQDSEFGALTHAADEKTVQAKKAAAQIITAFLTGAAFSDALALGEHAFGGGAIHESINAKPETNQVHPVHPPAPHHASVQESTPKAAQTTPSSPQAVHALSGMFSVNAREHLETQFLNQWQLEHPGTMPPTSEINKYIAAHTGMADQLLEQHEASLAPAPHTEQAIPPVVVSPPPAPLITPEHLTQSTITPPDASAPSIDSTIALTASIRDSIQSHASLTVPDALYSTDPTKALSPEAHAYLIQQVQHTGVGPKETESITDYLQRITKASYASGTHFYKGANDIPVIYGGDFDAQRLVAYDYLRSMKPGTRVLMPSLDGKSTSVGWMDLHGDYLEDRATVHDMPMNVATHDQGFFSRLFGSTPDPAPPIDPSKLTRIN